MQDKSTNQALISQTKSRTICVNGESLNCTCPASTPCWRFIKESRNTMEHTKEIWRITGKDEMDGIEIGMDNPDGTICPLINITWYGEDDCNAEEDEARANRLIQCWNGWDELEKQRDELLEALEILARLGNEPQLGNSDGNRIAQQAIAAAKQK